MVTNMLRVHETFKHRNRADVYMLNKALHRTIKNCRQKDAFWKRKLNQKRSQFIRGIYAWLWINWADNVWLRLNENNEWKLGNNLGSLKILKHFKQIIFEQPNVLSNHIQLTVSNNKWYILF